MSDPFWIFDPSVFLEDGNWYKIIPMKGMSTVEALNSLSLLVALASILAFLFTFNVTFIFIGIILLGAIVLYYYYLDSKEPLKIRYENYKPIESLSYPNTSEFVKHVYGNMKSCKENPEHCGFHSDTRHLRR